jgi:phenylacetate-CoA ligase
MGLSALTGLDMLSALLLVARMRSDQWRSREELESLQEELLRDTLAYASRNVPRYRAFGNRSLRSLEDLQELPIIGKDEVRADPFSFVSRRFSPERLLKARTSGSTGTPLTIYQEPGELKYNPAFELRQLTECGVKPTDVHARISADRHSPAFYERLGLYRRHYFLYRSAAQLLGELARLRPDVLRGPPSFMTPLARENRGRRERLSISRMFCFSEMLSQNARKLIESSFGGRVYDGYGSVETSWIAWECPEGSLHLHSDYLIAEIVDDEGNPVPRGRTGSIVLTPLWRRAMPLIRYRLGDRTAFGGRCRCGRGLHVLKPVEGRHNDLIALPSGNVISAHLIGFNLRSNPAILQFQAEQMKDLSITLRIIPVGGMSPAELQGIADNLRKVFPEPVELRAEAVDSIPSPAGRKLRDFISHARP